MGITFWNIKVGLESHFNPASPLWMYRSKYEPWVIFRLCGIYFWLHRRELRIGRQEK